MPKAAAAVKEPTEKVETETQTDFDTEAAVADISSDLFGQGSEEDEGKEAKSGGEKDELSDEPSVDVAKPSPQTADKEGEVKSEEETSAAVQAVGAPSTWTKEAIEKWATIDPTVQKEILKREDDMFKGIEQYKTAADIGMQYSKVVEPYAPILAAENIDPVGLFQSFAANHYLLTRGTTQQKVELAATMLQGYEIPLADLLNYIADQGEENFQTPSPEVLALRKELGEVKSLITSSQTAAQSAAQRQIDAEIEAFANDPAHPYFNELADDISKLFGAGLASTLTEAYEKALYANPTTRQKELDRLNTEAKLTAEAEAKKQKRTNSTAADVVLTPKSRDGTVPLGSIDDTLEATMAAIQSRG